jgi:precorrin-2 dehydrogenase/sirohydrochlorin ferrochelatase
LSKTPKKRSPRLPAKRARKPSRSKAPSKEEAPQSRKYYPAFIDLAGKPCVVVGGGKVAERKVLSLLEAGASVKVVSPELTARLKREKSSGSIRHTARRFRATDLAGAYLLIVSTDSPSDNIKISDKARAKGVPLINAVDMPEHCNFIVPASVRRGPLAIAVSTSGASPAMAREIRKELETLYGAGFGRYLERLERERARALDTIADAAERMRFLKSLASDKILKMLREGRSPEIKAPAGRGRRKKRK